LYLEEEEEKEKKIEKNKSNTFIGKLNILYLLS